MSLTFSTPYGNRKQRRAYAARKRTVIRKGEPFGRIAVTAFHEMDDGTARIDYTHLTKGRMSRVLTDQLLFSLQA